MSQLRPPLADSAVAVPDPAGAGTLAGLRVSRPRAVASYLGRRPGLVLAIGWIALMVLAAFWPGLIAPDNPLGVSVGVRAAPSAHHLFGTDEIGRDLFSRVVYGSRLTLRASLIAIGIGAAAGGSLGLLAGYAGGWVDHLAMRVADVLLAIPVLLLSLAVVLTLGFGITDVALAVGLAFIASSARVMRGQVLKIRQSPFIEAAAVGGARRARLLGRHVLPNAVEPVLVLAAMQFGEAILAVSTLSFLGYGVQPPAPEWGALVADGRDYLNSSWWLTTLPGLTIVVTVLAANRISRAFAEGSS
ncbi:MAG: ABC transporter permease [Nocardiopsaceae bacterium]|nr:ABC transporter permease [Nocardiopsaceae bacterium]